MRDSIPPSPERDDLIRAAYERGVSLGAIAETTGLSEKRIKQIRGGLEWKHYRNNFRRRRRWKPVILGGHPSFDDEYGVDHIYDPSSVWREDRELYGIMIG